MHFYDVVTRTQQSGGWGKIGARVVFPDLLGPTSFG